jgi:hypothetical protein
MAMIVPFILGNFADYQVFESKAMGGDSWLSWSGRHVLVGLDGTSYDVALRWPCGQRHASRARKELSPWIR